MLTLILNIVIISVIVLMYADAIPEPKYRGCWFYVQIDLSNQLDEGVELFIPLDQILALNLGICVLNVVFYFY